jgi:hypothetical protein
MGHSCVRFKAFIVYFSLTLQAFAAVSRRQAAISAASGLSWPTPGTLFGVLGHNPAIHWTSRAGY